MGIGGIASSYPAYTHFLPEYAANGGEKFWIAPVHIVMLTYS
ncbi:MAG TPA: hypothetical protein VJO32_16665 [Ktedonobacteraceae bacterium]|nr:hypothetical protein [Ktedonobacteraceae bacterium]